MPYLLDAMSQTGRNNCKGAWALYRLSASYTGPTIDVYNSGTAVTTSFYADIYGNLGTALNGTGTSIATSLGANTGYITKWYDQSGTGNHATQAYTLAPSVNYTNKYADFTTYSGTSYMNLPSGTVPEQVAYTVICKHGTVTNNNGGFIGGGNNILSQGNNFRLNGTTGYWNYWYNNDVGITYTPVAGNVVTFKYDGSSVTYGYVNSVLISSTARTGWNGQAGNEVLGKTTADVALNGQMYFLLVFKSALSDADRFAAENLSPYNKISFIPTTGPIDFLNIGAATNQTSGSIDLGTLQSQYRTFGGGAVDLNTCYSLVNGFTPAWCMDAANYQSGTVWKDANTVNNYDMTINASAYTPSWTDGTPTMRFDGAYGAAKRVVSGTLTTIPFTTSGTTMVCFSAINNLKGASASYDWDWRTLYRVGATNTNPQHPVIIEIGTNNSGTSRMGDWVGYFNSSGTDIVTGPVPIPYAYQQQNMLVHKLRNTSPYYEYQLNNVMTTYTITDVNASLVAGSGTASIGQWHNNDATTGSGSQWWGNVSAVFMYNSILTDAQIKDLYTRFFPRFYGFNNPSLGALPVTSGLVGWYTGESWTGTQWSDLSGNSNHATTIRGTISTGTFTNSPLKFIYGASTAGLKFPAAILPSTYTIFTVARYGNAAGTGTNYKRIFDGITTNWLSGFWNGFSGVAYHNNFLTTSTKTYHGTQWVISTDQNALYRSQGYSRTVAGAGSPSFDNISINYGYYSFSNGSEASDWSVAAVIVFNTTLSTADIQKMEKYLNIVYNVVAAPNLTPILVNPGTQSFTGGGSFTIAQNVTGTGDITWGISPTTGVSFSATSDTSATVAVDSGTGISTQNYTVTATNPSSVVCTTIFSLTNTLPSLYTMSFPFTFTNMGAVGQNGPTSITYGTNNPGYGTAYAMVLGTGATAGMQRWTVPQTRSYIVKLAGPGYATGLFTYNGFWFNYTVYGAVGTTTLSLTSGHVIRILVGQRPNTTITSYGRYPGCGGTFFYNETTSTLLAAVGGAGGSGVDTTSATGAGTNANPYTACGGKGLNGSTTTSGGTPPPSSGAGGTGGNGGQGSQQSPPNYYGAAGGGGYSTNGGNGWTGANTGYGGKAFVNGGQGGQGVQNPADYGGFGGGGACANIAGGGGAGGYSGGGGGATTGAGFGGGGGGSYTSTSWTSIAATNSGTGYVIVT